jgi:hypothetical protein
VGDLVGLLCRVVLPQASLLFGWMFLYAECSEFDGWPEAQGIISGKNLRKNPTSPAFELCPGRVSV